MFKRLIHKGFLTPWLSKLSQSKHTEAALVGVQIEGFATVSPRMRAAGGLVLCEGHGLNQSAVLCKGCG